MSNHHTPRFVGPPTEIFVYYFTEKVGRHWRRRLVRNTTVTRDHNLVAQGLPCGRYRVEWRDAKRWVARVETWVISTRGLHRLPPKGQRRGPRKVPPPVQLPTSLPRSAARR